MHEDLLSVSQAALLKRVSRNAVYKAIREGRLTSHLIAGHVALERKDVDAWTPHERIGRREGIPMSEETKRKISQSQKQRWQHRKDGSS